MNMPPNGFLNSKINVLVENRKRQGEYAEQNTRKPTILDSFNVLADWTAVNATAEEETTIYKTGGKAVKHTPSANGSTLKKTGLHWPKTSSNFSAYYTDFNFEFNFWCSDKDKLTSMQVYLYNANGQFFWKGWTSSSSTAAYTGWNCFRFAKSEFTNSGTASWGSEITRIDFNINTTGSGGYPYLVWDSVVLNVKEKAYFVMTLDDCFTSHYDFAYPLLTQNGFKSSLVINASQVGTAGKMTLSQLTELYNNGWDIINHAYNHIDLGSSTYTVVAKEIADNKNYLIANGFTKGVNELFAYPGAWSAMAEQVLTDHGYKFARNSSGSFNQYSSVFGYSNPLKMWGLPTSETATYTASLKPTIDACIANGGVVMLYCHDLQTGTPATGQFSRTEFQTLVEALKVYGDAGSIEVITMSEWYDKLFEDAS